MNFSKALDVTLDKFGITGKWLSSESGVSEQMISGFRNGKQRVWSDSLDRIFLALPEEAKQYFLSLLLGSSVSPHTELVYAELESIALRMNLMQVGQMMGLLSKIITKESRVNAESSELMLRL